MKFIFRKIKSALLIGLLVVLVSVSIYMHKPPIALAQCTNVVPATGPVGTSVVLTGGVFDGTSGATFDGVAATVTSQNPTQLTVTVPAGVAVGTSIIAITGSGSGAPQNCTFTVTASAAVSDGRVGSPSGPSATPGGGAVPQLDGINPNKFIAGDKGGQVTLNGHNFSPDVIIDINGTNLPANAIASHNATEIVVKIPDKYTEKEGVLNFRVANDFGSPNIFPSAFTAEVRVAPRSALDPEELSILNSDLNVYVKKDGSMSAESLPGIKRVEAKIGQVLSLTGGDTPRREGAVPVFDINQGSLKGSLDGLAFSEGRAYQLVILKNGNYNPVYYSRNIFPDYKTTGADSFFVEVSEHESVEVRIILAHGEGSAGAEVTVTDLDLTFVFVDGKLVRANVSRINLKSSSFSAIQEGANTLTYTVTDEAENVSSVSIDFGSLPLVSEGDVEIEVVEEPVEGGLSQRFFIGIAPLDEELSPFSVSIFESDQSFAELSRLTQSVFMGIAPGTSIKTIPPFIGLAPLEYAGISEEGISPIDIFLTPRGGVQLSPIEIRLTPKEAQEKDVIVDVSLLEEDVLEEEIIIDFTEVPEVDTTNIELEHSPPQSDQSTGVPKKGGAAAAEAIAPIVPPPQTVNELFQGWISGIFGLNSSPSLQYFPDGHDARFSESTFERWSEAGHDSAESKLKIDAGHSVYGSNLSGWGGK